MTSEKTDIEKLEERVEKLEEQQEEFTVEDGDGESWSLTELMDRFSIKRRTALKAIGLVAIGYTAPRAVLQAVSGTAQAQQSTADLTVSGQLDAGSVSTDEAFIGSSPVDRPLISNGDTTVYVDPDNGSNDGDGTETDPVATIQEAVNRAPVFLRHQHYIDISTAASTPTTYDEDVIINGIISSGQAFTTGAGANPVEGPATNFRIEGDPDDNTAVTVSSITAAGCTGVASPHLKDFTVNGISPYYEAKHAVEFYGGGEYQASNLRFGSNVDNGIRAYGAIAEVRGCDFSNCDEGTTAKRNAQILAQNCSGTPNKSYVARSGSTLAVYDDATTPTEWRFGTINGARIWNDDKLWSGNNSRASFIRSGTVSSSDFEEFVGNNVTVGGGSDETIFDLSNPVDVINGQVLGNAPRRLTATFADGAEETVAVDTSNAYGSDENGDGFAVLSVPPLHNVTKLTFNNGVGTSTEYGWAVQTVSSASWQP
ncbi:hypothetical protein [Halobacterium sp. CBA1126]|uniref:hypothetical protein n=1 Tax=Halobacterium sp. CBA1126 TaxID=2668074 RepID=UPI0012F76718|nr:hypothetical protein [Halobacterium sp. CBA1126]MUV59825.1 hypothetical protein [Halobacterium sp. CBA1126]